MRVETALPTVCCAGNATNVKCDGIVNVKGQGLVVFVRCAESACVWVAHCSLWCTAVLLVTSVLHLPSAVATGVVW